MTVFEVSPGRPGLWFGHGESSTVLLCSNGMEKDEASRCKAFALVTGKFDIDVMLTMVDDEGWSAFKAQYMCPTCTAQIMGNRTPKE